MFTSSFAISGKDRNAIAISNGTKGFERIRKYSPLIPPWWMVKRYRAGELSREEFTRLYRREQLEKMDAAKVATDLGRNAILLCWEKPGAFCHRRLVAGWLEEQLDITVPELSPPPAIVEQPSLW